MNTPPFHPEQHYLQMHRMCREPKGGRILWQQTYGPLDLALYQPEDMPPTYSEWRVLEPPSPVPVDRIILTRGEGPTHLCNQPTIVRRKHYPGTGDPNSIFGEPWEASAFNVAGSTLLLWGMTAPKDGGYDKCDFEIFWTDGSHYAGRFDLQHGGTEGGENFHDSFRSRLLHYTGLGYTPAPFFRKNAVESYTAAEARRRYQAHVGRYDPSMPTEAIDMLARLEV